MELKLIRSALKSEYTIGHLYIDGKYFCDTIEDTVRTLNKREDKVYGETAIPFGEYDVIMNVKSPKYTERGKNDPYYAKFNGIMPRILDVPFFDGILIHPGQTQKDSFGCIIVGQNKEVGKVINSRVVFDKLHKILSDANRKGDTITINIVRK